MLLLLLLGERVLGFVGEYIPISAEFITGWSRMRFVPMAAALLFMLSAVYFFSPSKIQKVRYILPGAILSMGVWMLFSLIFSYYVDHMGRYSIIYWLHRGHHRLVGVDGLEYDCHAYGCSVQCGTENHLRQTKRNGNIKNRKFQLCGNSGFVFVRTG